MENELYMSPAESRAEIERLKKDNEQLKWRANTFEKMSIEENALINKLNKEIERLREENSKLKKEKELAVWGLRGKLFKIANHDTLNGEKYNNYQWAYEGVVKFAQMALQEIKETKYLNTKTERGRNEEIKKIRTNISGKP